MGTAPEQITAPVSQTGTDAEFEVLDQDNQSMKSYTASSCDHSLLNGEMINDQYVNLNQYGTATPVTQSETECDVKSLCQSIANQHIIDSQEEQIQNLQSENEQLMNSLTEKDKKLKQYEDEIAALQRERDNLQKKLSEVNNCRSGATQLTNSAVL